MSTTRSGAATAAPDGVVPAVGPSPFTHSHSDAGERAVRDRVYAALASVRDPELDRPITELKFVSSCEVSGGHVRIRLRLPTYFCAPNFAYLMVVDALDAVEAVPGVVGAEVRLEDHFAADEINAGAARRAGFQETFPGEAVDELAELRRTFRRKAHQAALERACRGLLAAGRTLDDLPDVRLGALPRSPETDGLLRRRAGLGLPTDPDARLLVDEDGTPIAAADVPLRLRFAKAVRVSIDANTQYCSGLLATRYPES
ncbi:iron-sulfur cluster assembly protein [Cryptosporangium aurantiacum]|uniref:Metal-sulfur cluster biosynthetic enzyme n=1 Tax=Cryptosporangium aurantiacum TaxID=134849 RepID=A0A1M7KRH6_9ACTN|nr:iron-sulfur cluster assembly protein [Cryptosporangium aurantiacum]SHM68108.1 Metal-sulfur cluster biosynthetic enzyme [Cryptosporangium aurantiacum]